MWDSVEQILWRPIDRYTVWCCLTSLFSLWVVVCPSDINADDVRVGPRRVIVTLFRIIKSKNGGKPCTVSHACEYEISGVVVVGVTGRCVHFASTKGFENWVVCRFIERWTSVRKTVCAMARLLLWSDHLRVFSVPRCGLIICVSFHSLAVVWSSTCSESSAVVWSSTCLLSPSL